MLTTLIRRELLDNLMTFRFAAAILIMLLLGVANTVVLIYPGRISRLSALRFDFSIDGRDSLKRAWYIFSCTPVVSKVYYRYILMICGDIE